MATNKKISQLDPITTFDDPANDVVTVMVPGAASAANRNKKMTINNFFAAPPPIGGTTPAAVTGTKLAATGDTAAGDDAAMGYRPNEGLILTGQGSSNDVTVKNDADESVITVPTGTRNVSIAAGDIILGTAGKGIDFSAAGGGLLDNFDDSETYEVSLTASTSGTITLDSDFNTLLVKTKGDEITVSGYIRVDSVSSPVGNLTMPLPYTAASLNEGQAYATGPIMIIGPVNPPLNGPIPMVYLAPGGTSISIADMGATGPLFDMATHMGVNTRLIFSFTYRKA